MALHHTQLMALLFNGISELLAVLDQHVLFGFDFLGVRNFFIEIRPVNILIGLLFWPKILQGEAKGLVFIGHQVNVVRKLVVVWIPGVEFVVTTNSFSLSLLPIRSLDLWVHLDQLLVVARKSARGYSLVQRESESVLEKKPRVLFKISKPCEFLLMIGLVFRDQIFVRRGL